MENNDNHREEQNNQDRNYTLEVTRERVENLWKQAQGHRRSSKSDLAVARAARPKAERERQRIASEAMEATRAACVEIIEEAERQLAKAREADAEANRKVSETEDGWTRAHQARVEAEEYQRRAIEEGEATAERVRSEADAYGEKVMADARGDAAKVRSETGEYCQQSMDDAREQAERTRTETHEYREQVVSDARREAETLRTESESYRDRMMTTTREEAGRAREEGRRSALEECEELKRHVTYEVQCILDEADSIKAAAQEELEAQMIYAEVAKLKAMSHDVHDQVLDTVGKALRERRNWKDACGTAKEREVGPTESVWSQVAHVVGQTMDEMDPPSSNGHVASNGSAETAPEPVEQENVAMEVNGHSGWNGNGSGDDGWMAVQPTDAETAGGEEAQSGDDGQQADEVTTGQDEDRPQARTSRKARMASA